MSMPEAGRIRVDTQGAVATLVIDNPDRRNAIGLHMWHAMAQALDELSADTNIRALVIRGEGSRAFASGADISRFDQERSEPAGVQAYAEATRSVLHRIARSRLPVIAMIHGACVGGGLNLALACDIRISDEHAVFAIPAAKLGVGYGREALARLAAAVGPARAREMVVSARRLEASQALAWGLVSDVVPHVALADVVTERAQVLAGLAPLTIMAAKLSVEHVLLGDPAMAQAADLAVDACFASDDYVEGRRAFGEKRVPVFDGR
ncbi:enoyl-CoA hydratase [Tistrella sp.]|jgi:enoyl-CoA hydratase/carnithine racemase|uniref:Enoyl-CoA hydratase n=1 Tax=Tistrella mobilis TaxID=171437 RepID=A0A3B9IGY6_9PROT|nr:enoyl-CoA hydratase [Tistrella sp.]MAD36520.1 enoyl-CoA hydratase [Tistrella sp.]HAE46986.1 enoyl-CoA hydratase [Tistrella mobilis]